MKKQHLLFRRIRRHLRIIAMFFFGGTTVTGGTGTGIVIAVGTDTVYGGLNLVSANGNHGFDRGANSIAWVMIRFMMILVPVVFLACGLTKGNWSQAFLLSACVGIALLAAMVISSLVGTVVPLFFHKIKVDPAVASGPLITTVNDLVAVITYYGLAWILLIQILHIV